MPRKPDFISGVRTDIAQLLDALTRLAGPWTDEYNAMGYSGSLLDADFTGTNAGYLAADFKTALGNAKTVHDALISSGTVAVGTMTTLYKMR